MAHPIVHAKSSAKQFGGKWEEYIHLHEWLDETKSWFGDSMHRMFRHHSEGIFEMEQRFGKTFVNSDGKEVFVRYVGDAAQLSGRKTTKRYLDANHLHPLLALTVDAPGQP